MISKTHIQKFNAIKKYTPSQKDIKNLRAHIYDFIPFIQTMARTYGITSPGALRNYASNLGDMILDSYSKNGFIDSFLYEHQALEYLIKNPSYISKNYSSLLDYPNTHTMYSANFNRSLKLVLVNAISEVKVCERAAKKYGIKPNTSINNLRILNAEDPELAKIFFQTVLDVTNAKSMENKILTILKTHKIKNENSVKQQLIDSLKFTYETLNIFGFMNSYYSSYKYNSEKFDFASLDYEMFTNLCSKDDIGLKDSFSPKFLETLDNDSLCFMNAFWCNRFAKECAKLNSVTCAIDSLNLWQQILDNADTYKLSDTSLANALRKNAFLSELLTDTITQHQNNITSQTLKQGIKFSGTLCKDYTSYYTQLHNYIGNDYANFFSATLPSQNHFMDDLIFLKPFCNLQSFAYHKKDTTLEALIKMAFDNPHIKNWGLIRNELFDGSYIDSIDSKKSRILVGFDIEGFNLPFRFHISADSVMDLAKLSNQNTLIPEYQGAEDFIVDDELIPSNIIMPIPKRHKKIIMDSAKDNSKNTNLWEHFYFLMNGKFPKHLSEVITKGKNQTILARKPICYTDLKTGKRYVKINNKIQELEDSNVR